MLKALVLLMSCSATAQESSAESVYEFTLTDIDGKPVDLKSYDGKVLLIVNVASKCGNTPQYEGLQKLYEQYKDRGLVVLGFPANNFMGQEPGTEEDIKAFCTSNYGVTFPMFSKISVKGPDTHPLYSYLIANTESNVTWNFQKFLVGRDGKVVTSFTPKTQPMDESILTEIEAQL
jgi:glutathione peroxidase